MGHWPEFQVRDVAFLFRDPLIAFVLVLLHNARDRRVTT